MSKKIKSVGYFEPRWGMFFFDQDEEAHVEATVGMLLGDESPMLQHLDEMARRGMDVSAARAEAECLRSIAGIVHPDIIMLAKMPRS